MYNALVLYQGHQGHTVNAVITNNHMKLEITKTSVKIRFTYISN